MLTRYAPFLAYLASLLIALVLSSGFLAPTIQARSLGDTSGMLSGVVLNGTHGNAPVAGQAVTLQAYTSHATAQTVGQTTTDANGHFTFSGLDGSGGTPYALVTQFQNGQFGSGVISFDGGPTKQTNLTVYDTTPSDSALSITLTSVLFSEPDKQTGTIPVGEFFTFNNAGNTAFVASTPSSSGAPMGVLKFALPPNATNVTLGAGFAGVQAGQVGNTLGAAATVPPGKSQFAFSFDIPYSNTQYAFPFTSEYRTAQVATLVPVDVMVDTHDLTAQQPVTAMGQQYQLLTRDSIAAHTQLSLRLSHLPIPGEPPDLDFRQLLAVGAGLVLLLALLFGLYVKRGDLAVALRLVSAATPTSGGASSHDTAELELGAERKHLLEELLALEDGHRTGKLSEAAYRQQRQVTRDQLKAVLVQGIPSRQAQGSPLIDDSLREQAAHGSNLVVPVQADVPAEDHIASGGRS